MTKTRFPSPADRIGPATAMRLPGLCRMRPYRDALCRDALCRAGR